MKIKYKFITGEVTEIEVSENIGNIILDSRRIESNQNRKERYHCFSIEGADYEGDDYADYNTPEALLLGKEAEKDSRIKMQAFLASLTEIQRERLSLYIKGISMRQIAEKQKVSFKSISESFEGIRKKVKKFL